MNATDPGEQRTRAEDRELAKRYKFVRQQITDLGNKHPRAKAILEQWS